MGPSVLLLKVTFSSTSFSLCFQVAKVGCTNSPLRKAPGSGACPAEAVPCAPSGPDLPWWGRRCAGLALAQHSLAPPLRSCEGFGQLKQQRQNLAPHAAWCCGKRKGKTLIHLQLITGPWVAQALLCCFAWAKVIIRLCSASGFPNQPLAVLRQVQLKDRLDGAGAVPQPQIAQLQRAEEQSSSGQAAHCSGKGSNMCPPQLQQHS